MATENKVILDSVIERRGYWIEKIRQLSGNFGSDTDRLEKELEEETQKTGIAGLVGHLRFCGNIPENYGHDSSEEKLYSKYTDCLISLAYQVLGLQSIVLKERSDAADVEVFAETYSFVADAKAFRLSRTAKNQKDFKITAMDSWKRGKRYAMVVCPIYQLPNRQSQIYEQAVTRNVCIFTYSHLAVLVNYAEIAGKTQAQLLLERVFQTIPALISTKNAIDFWLAINRTMLSYSPNIESLWQVEKQAANEAILIEKQMALNFLAQEREKIMRMSREEALKELLQAYKIDNKIQTIQSVTDNGLFVS